MKTLISFLVLAVAALAQDRPPNLTLKATSDFLALHLSGKAPPGTTALQYRVAESGAVAESAPWISAQVPLENEGAFALSLPLKTSRWSEVQVRALNGETVLAKQESHRAGRAFQMLTAERIATLPESERAAWTAYLRRSNESFEKEYDALAAECRKLALARAKPAPSNRAMFTRDAAQDLADVVMSYQTPTGGWSKAVDYAAGPRQPGTHWTGQTGGDGWHYCGTLDNRSTTEQIFFLASVYAATKREDVKAAVMRGLDWLFAAQLPNGGWPQNYPVEPGYHEAITLNDDAITHVLEVLLDIAQGNDPFAFADDALRQRARASFDKGIGCLAAAQVKVDGKPTVWCAQHDPLTLAPVAARLKEPPSLSGAESANLLKFFMRKAPVDATITAMIEPALAWLDAHRITGLRNTKNAAGKTDYVADGTSDEVYWARFYDVQTGKPMFAGSQDGIVYSTFSEMAAKNRVGYDYYTTKPRDLIEKEVIRWRKRLASEK